MCTRAGTKGTLLGGRRKRIPNALERLVSQAITSLWNKCSGSMRISLLATLVGSLLAAQAGRAQPFVHVTSGPLAADEDDSTGASWADVNMDGHLDVFVTNFKGPNKLYYGNGHGGFVVEPFYSPGGAQASCLADLDNDSDIDIIIAYLNYDENHILETESRIYWNQGDLFVRYNLSSASYSRDVAVGDFDSDGNLDFALARTIGRSRIYKNIDYGIFAQVPVFVPSFVVTDASSLSWSDYNSNGIQELLLVGHKTSGNASITGENSMIELNQYTGVFEDLNAELLTTDRISSTGISWADYDNDGDLDAFVSSGNVDDDYVVTKIESNKLYINSNNEFINSINVNYLDNMYGSSGGAWGDFDNDGDLDLYIYSSGGLDALFLNDGYQLGLGEWMFPVVQYNSTSSASWVDFDDDGDLDLFLTNRGRQDLEPQGAPNFLLRNERPPGSWLHVDLVGTRSNPHGVGAIIRALAPINGDLRWQMRIVTTRSGPHVQDGLGVHFGFGDAEVIDSLIVQWPSGVRQVLADVPVKQRLTLTEPPFSTGVEPLPVESLPTLSIFPNPSRSGVTIGFAATNLPEIRSAEVFDVVGRRVRRLPWDSGAGELVWDGLDEQGHRVSAGAYFVRVVAASGHMQSRGIVMLPQ